jgi:hypothetical protein
VPYRVRIHRYRRPFDLTRITRSFLAIASAAMILAPAAHARSSSPRTVAIRAPVPAAGDLTVTVFEMSIGGEGSHHRRQRVHLELRNRAEPGVFALARLRPEPHHPGRFLGVLEVFHRASAAAAAQRLEPAASLPGRQPPAPAHASDALGSDEFLMRARNEHLIKEVVKANIEALADAHLLGADQFCDPASRDEYVLGNAIIGAAYVLAGPLTGLPTNTSASRLADDAVHELCDDIEDEAEGGSTEDESAYAGIAVLQGYLGTVAPPTPGPVTYPIGFSGQWALVEPAEVRLSGSFTWSVADPALDTAEPVDVIKVILPPAGTMPRAVTNYICPSQLPAASIATTNYANDTLTCGGGALPINQPFMLNVQSAPAPAAGMGGTLVAHQSGVYLAPFTFGGP